MEVNTDEVGDVGIGQSIAGVRLRKAMATVHGDRKAKTLNALAFRV